MVVLLYSDILNFGCVALPWDFRFYILKYKIFLINFLDELGNFKQIIFILQNVIFFYILKQRTQRSVWYFEM